SWKSSSRTMRATRFIAAGLMRTDPRTDCSASRLRRRGRSATPTALLAGMLGVLLFAKPFANGGDFGWEGESLFLRRDGQHGELRAVEAAMDRAEEVEGALRELLVVGTAIAPVTSNRGEQTLRRPAIVEKRLNGVERFAIRASGRNRAVVSIEHAVCL